MLLNLYKVADSDNVMNKVKTDLKQLQVNLKRDFDLNSPSLIILNDETFNCTDYNYCEIPELNHSYFINGIDNIGKQLYRLDCSCDVLETFKSEILNSQARFYRNVRPGDYVNGQLETSTKETITLYDSNVTLSDSENIILTTAGIKE